MAKLKSRLRKIRCWAIVPKRGFIDGIYRTKGAAKPLLKPGQSLCKLEGFYVEPPSEDSPRG